MDEPPLRFPGRADHQKKEVKNDQRHAAGGPASGKLPQNELAAADRLGQERKDGPLFPLGGDLPGGCGDGDENGGSPDQQKGGFLDEPDDFLSVKETDAGERDGHDRDQDKEDVKILAAVEFLADDA